MKRIAVTSRSFSRHPVLREELIVAHPEAQITFNDEGLSLVGDALIAYLRGHEMAITALEPIDAGILAALPDLRVISKYGVGFDMLDLDALRARGLRLGWTGGVNKRSVSELVISTAIGLLRHVLALNAEVRDGTWHQRVGSHLSARTVGIVGCGHVGQDLARLLCAFGCRVLAFDIRQLPGTVRQLGVEPTELDRLLRESDVVTLHLPKDPSTENMITADRLALMKPGAILINMARGGLVDEAALKSALSNGRLAGAALDVFAEEPPGDSELINMPNVIVTPHIGGSAEEAILNMGRAAILGLTENLVPKPGIHPEGYGGYRGRADI